MEEGGCCRRPDRVFRPATKPEPSNISHHNHEECLTGGIPRKPPNQSRGLSRSRQVVDPATPPKRNPSTSRTSHVFSRPLRLTTGGPHPITRTHRLRRLFAHSSTTRCCAFFINLKSILKKIERPHEETSLGMCWADDGVFGTRAAFRSR